MSRIVLFCVIVLAAFPCAAQDKATFPTDEEVQLLLTQAHRAMAQYKPLIDDEERLFGKHSAEAIAKDRQVIQWVEIAAEVLRKQPSGFNSPAGFKLFEFLTDAGQNALLCAQGASSQASLLMAVGKTDNAPPLTQLAQSCIDVYALINTVTENAGSLYERYVKAEQDFADEGFKVSKTCTDALKKMAAEKKQ